MFFFQRAERAVPQRYSRFVPECLNVAFPLICKEVFDHGTYSARAWEGGCRVCGIWRSAIILIQASCHKANHIMVGERESTANVNGIQIEIKNAIAYFSSIAYTCNGFLDDKIVGFIVNIEMAMLCILLKNALCYGFFFYWI
ncbi:uncharacterized protein LOC131077052 isoform X1 [Cryptomeria japonica]|uniref:uncharacterized protein LOC131077052 isoform X1 n=1 Tax=Cryptomeria japonica TaxID=3369 RepID=UPI0025AB77C8|nr:uncharacterized protein LOC131077052 isoform X1 [Cryptomeria japonica]